MGLGIKTTFSKLILVPLVQLYIRHLPFRVGKKFLYDYLSYVEKKYITSTCFGSKITGKTNDLIQGHIYYFGVWEPDITNFIKCRLDGLRDRTFIDVGANIGYHTLLAAHCMPQGQIVSIEAFPTIFNQLEENIRINAYKNVRTLNCAATDGHHNVEMYYTADKNEGRTSSRRGDLLIETPVVVKGLPLSDILTHWEVSTARLIKIDVEGAEYEVLKGMYQILHLFPNDIEFVVEISPSMLRREEISEIFAKFGEAGFFPYQLVNPYDPEYYISYKTPKTPARLREIPAEQADVVFSRIDAEYLDDLPIPHLNY